MPHERQFPPIDFKTRFPALDGIRALAVTLVFLVHYGGGSHGGRPLKLLNAIRLQGWIGVDLFFVLSGFLITGILFDTRKDSHFFQRFFARRSLRIFPVFYMVFFILLLLTPIFHYQWHWLHLTFLVYMGNFFANHDWSLYRLACKTHPHATVFLDHLWSLCVEEQFYLLWPIVIWTVRDRMRLIWTACGISVLSLFLRIGAVALLPINIAAIWIPRTLPFRMDTLLIGGILALLLRGPNADRWQRYCRPIALVGSILLLIFFAEAAKFTWTLTIGFSLIAVTGAGWIGYALRQDSLAFKFFHLRPLRVLGKYSYGFYLYHLLYYSAWLHVLNVVIRRTHSIFWGGILVLPCNFFAAFLLAKLSYDLVEVRFLRWKSRFEYDSEQVEHKHVFPAS